MSEGPAPICVVLGVELLPVFAEDEAAVVSEEDGDEDIVVDEGDVVVLVSWAITGRAQARPRVAAAATWESFFMEMTPWVSMDP
jgi:hypothetical protein